MKFIGKAFLASVCALAMLAVSPAVNADELLSNGGFESAIEGPNTGVAGNWNWFVLGADTTSSASIETIAPLSGVSHLDLIMAGTDNSFVGVQQSHVGVAEGTDYTFSFNARTDGNALGIGAEFRIEWLDTDGNFVGDQFANNEVITGSLTDSYQLFTQTRVAPTDAAEVRVVFALQSFGGGDNTGRVYLDDASLIGVPEPSSAIVLAMGVVGLVTRRRRG